jgi:ribonuclease HII
MIFGVDEAGRGPLAGPVVAAAVLLSKPRPSGLDDSKKLTAARRAELEATIKRRCQWAIGVVEVEDIDRLNIFGATMLAMTLAVDALCAKLGSDPIEVLVDGNMTPAGRRPEWRWPARAIVGGDAIEPCISAASIIAMPMRSFTLPSGLKNSHLRAMVASRPAVTWLSFTKGVRPTVSMMLL